MVINGLNVMAEDGRQMGTPGDMDMDMVKTVETGHHHWLPSCECDLKLSR